MGLVRRNRGLIPAQVACQVSDRGPARYPIGAKAVGFSHGDFSLVVQALYDPKVIAYVVEVGVGFQVKRAAAFSMSGVKCISIAFGIRENLACCKRRAAVSHCLGINKSSSDFTSRRGKQIALASALQYRNFLFF